MTELVFEVLKLNCLGGLLNTLFYIPVTTHPFYTELKNEDDIAGEKLTFGSHAQSLKVPEAFEVIQQ